jgi:hypothetical protein
MKSKPQTFDEHYDEKKRKNSPTTELPPITPFKKVSFNFESKLY